jgi:hypothetical protein
MSDESDRRPRKDVLVAFRMDDDTNGFIDLVSGYTGLSRSEVIRSSVRSLRRLVFMYLAKKKDEQAG